MIRTVFLLAILVFLSCSLKEKESTSYFQCKNLEKYFAGIDTLPVILFNITDSSDYLKKTIDSLSKATIDVIIKFRVRIDVDSLSRPVFLQSYSFNKYSPENSIPYLEKRNVLEIRQNSADMLLIEGELGDTQYLKKQVVKFITNFGKDKMYSDNPRSNTISFQWDKGTSQKAFNLTLKAIIESYTEILKKASFKQKKKKYCELTVPERDSLNTEYPFRIHLGFPQVQSNYPPPPLPYLFEDIPEISE